MMNEFTKEELEQLLFDIDAKIFMVKREKSYIDADYLKLRDKIQSMIDNYCEHEYKATGFSEEICECSKCGERE